MWVMNFPSTKVEKFIQIPAPMIILNYTEPEHNSRIVRFSQRFCLKK